MANYTSLDVKSDTYKGLTPQIKNSLWNIAVLNAPYRTGNLRSAIKRYSTNENKVMYIYSESQAYYTDFLEKGIGRNKKHVGFIESKTVGAMVDELLTNIVQNKVTFSGTPFVAMRTDKQRNYERKMMRAMGYSSEIRLSATDRAKLSRIKYLNTNRRATGTGLERYGNSIESIGTVGGNR